MKQNRKWRNRVEDLDDVFVEVWASVSNEGVKESFSNKWCLGKLTNHLKIKFHSYMPYSALKNFFRWIND